MVVQSSLLLLALDTRFGDSEITIGTFKKSLYIGIIHCHKVSLSSH